MATWSPCLLLPLPDTLPLHVTYGVMNTRLITSAKIPQYKMQGWYATGSVWETWTAYGNPNTTPPSGHTLTNVTFVQVQ